MPLNEELKVTNANHTQKYRENKADKAVENYICTKIDWGVIEDQLAGSDLITGKQYAYVPIMLSQKGQVIVRILGDDGGV
jgi:hypothetical protein